MNWKTGTLFAAGLAVGVAAGVAGVMSLNDGNEAPSSASRTRATGAPAAARADAAPVVATGPGLRCAGLAPLLAKGPEDDGKESLQEAAGVGTSEISALLLKGKEAAAGERPRDAEVLFINACRKAQAAQAGDLAAADAQYQLARHYANAAAFGAARPKELYERANRLYSASLQIYEARHGASHERTKFARDGLVTVQQVTGVLPPLPAVAQARQAAPAPAAARKPAPAPAVVAAAPAPVPATPSADDLQKASAQKAQAEKVAQAERAAQAERVAQAQRAAQAERVAQAQRAVQAERVAQAQRAQAERALAARAQAERVQAAKAQAEKAQAERALAAKVLAEKAQAERAQQKAREQVAALPAPAPRRTTSPSFNCAQARSITEKLICGDEELARMDRDLGRLHQRAKEAAPDRRAFQRASDAEWQQREATCRDRECLRNWYAERRQELSAAAEAPRPAARPAPVVVRAPARVARAEPPVRRAQRQEPAEIALPPGTASGDAGAATMGSN